jgi:hypothetical protein
MLPFDVAAPMAAAHPDRDIEIGLGFPIHSLNISFGKSQTLPVFLKSARPYSPFRGTTVAKATTFETFETLNLCHNIGAGGMPAGAYM